MDMSVRYLQNDVITPSDKYGLDIVIGSVAQKVLISDTTLRSFVSPQVLKMTPKLHQICGCEICIIPKDMQIYLNRCITKLQIHVQQKSVIIHKHNSAFSTTSSAHYNEKVFPYGEFLHATIIYVAQSIRCTLIKPKNIIHMKCYLGFL